MAIAKLSAEKIIAVLQEKKCNSLTGLFKALGGKSRPSSSFSKKVKQIVPNIAERLSANEPGNKSAGKKNPVVSPYRQGSAYNEVYLLLAKHPAGIARSKLVDLAHRKTGKRRQLCEFDVAVVLSASQSPNGPRHKSARDGYWIERENDFVKLRVG